jgi:hypothetical protein
MKPPKDLNKLFNRNFGDNFEDNFDRNFNRVATGIGIWSVISMLASLGFLGLLIYVAAHFLAKVW